MLKDKKQRGYSHCCAQLASRNYLTLVMLSEQFRSAIFDVFIVNFEELDLLWLALCLRNKPSQTGSLSSVSFQSVWADKSCCLDLHKRLFDSLRKHFSFS